MTPVAAGSEQRGGREQHVRRVSIWRVRDRATMAALARRHPARSGPVTVAFLPGSSEEPARVAYSVGRRLGGAVSRNRIRRRLRAAVAEVARCGGLASGVYMVGASSAEVASLPFPALREHVAAATAAATSMDVVA